jgi:hypothetical protein
VRREYIRHGTLSWFINFDVVIGQVIEPSWGATRTEEDARAHIQRLIASDPHATRVASRAGYPEHSSVRSTGAALVAAREQIAAETLGIKGKNGILHSMESRAAILHDPIHEVVCYYTRHPRLLDEKGWKSGEVTWSARCSNGAISPDFPTCATTSWRSSSMTIARWLNLSSGRTRAWTPKLPQKS